MTAGAAFRSHRPTQTEVAFCRCDISEDLLAERFGAGETSLVAQTLEEGQGQGCLFVETDGVEVQQVGFDGEGVGSEGRAVADVGDGVKCFGGWACSDGESGDVDAVGGEKLCVRGEVDGGDGVARAVAAT